MVMVIAKLAFFYDESLLVFGASGNTGMMAIQFANKMSKGDSSF